MIYLISYLSVGVLMSIYYFEEIKSGRFNSSVNGFEDLSLPGILFCTSVAFPGCFIFYGTISIVVYIDRFIKRLIK